MKKSLALLLLAFTTGFLIRFPTPALAGPPDNLQVAMRLLKLNAAKLGAPSVKGEETVDGKSVPALYFGTTKMNNNFVMVNEVQKEVGGTATIFVKSGNDFIRVATNVKKDDGSRAIGTVLDPKGKAIASIAKGESYFGEADILGKSYDTAYEPIRGESGDVIGIYYVGFLKN